jgi:hypothetical protein
MTEQNYDPAISRLIAKRMELARVVAELEKELDRHRADLAHIDGALRVLCAGLDPSLLRPRRRYRRTQYFGHNELSRLCLNTLRLAGDEPLTSREITTRIMTAKSLEMRDESLFAAVRVQVGAVLKRLSRKQIAAPSGNGVRATWRLLPSD